MIRHRIVMARPGVYRIVATPQSLIQRVWSFLFRMPHRPEPTRLAPTLAVMDEGAHLIPTITISLAALRQARPTGGAL